MNKLLGRALSRVTRDMLLFLMGAYGFVVQVHADKPSEALIIGCVALMGGPAVFRWDEKKQKDAE